MTSLDQLDLTALRVLDGGMATELAAAGCDISGPLWSAHVLRDHPEKIVAVHASYLEAGADCILTSSYQASAEGYAEIGLSAEDAASDLRRSVDLAILARNEFVERSRREVVVGASLGPYGAALHNGAEYHGNYDISFGELVEFHARRIAALAETSADLLAFETVPSLEEVRAIITALGRFPDLAAWISFTCKDDQHVVHGELVSECAALLDSLPQMVAVGINCTAPSLIAALVRQVKSVTKKPVVVYPNSGETWNADARCWSGHSDPGAFGLWAAEWREAGAQIIGGCCRTGPEHVRSVRRALVHSS